MGGAGLKILELGASGETTKVITSMGIYGERVHPNSACVASFSSPNNPVSQALASTCSLCTREH